MSDHELLGELLASASNRLAAYGYLLTGSQSAGEELVQEAIVTVFIKRRSLPNVRAAESYVRATMRTTYIDGLRRDKRWRRVAPAQAHRSPEPDAAAQIADRDAIGRALASLSTQERTVVVLRFYDDLTLAAVADAMHLQTGTVKRYLSNALDKLAREVGEHDFDTERIAVIEGRD